MAFFTFKMIFTNFFWWAKKHVFTLIFLFWSNSSRPSLHRKMIAVPFSENENGLLTTPLMWQLHFCVEFFQHSNHDIWSLCHRESKGRRSAHTHFAYLYLFFNWQQLFLLLWPLFSLSIPGTYFVWWRFYGMATSGICCPYFRKRKNLSHMKLLGSSLPLLNRVEQVGCHKYIRIWI